MLAMMMFCVFSAVSFADRFIPVLPSINRYPRDQLRDCTGVFGQQTCPQHPMLL